MSIRVYRTRLSLGDDIMSLDAGQNSTLLDGRRLLETVGIDTAQQFFLQVHIVKVVHHLKQTYARMFQKTIAQKHSTNSIPGCC